MVSSSAVRFRQRISGNLRNRCVMNLLEELLNKLKTGEIRVKDLAVYISEIE